MTDYYKILGISKTATEQEIKKAYKKMALKWHPDKNLDNKKEAEQKFKEISEAYQVLSDPEKRKIYNQFGKEGLNNNGVGGDFFNNINPNDLFGSVFGNIFGQQFGNTNKYPFNFQQSNFQQSNFQQANFQQNKPQKREINHNVECTLEELYHGSTKQIFVENKQYTINIKPGWKEHTKISFNEQHYNITFTIKEKKHDIYIKADDNLILEKKINLLDALKGFETSIQSINGKNHTVNTGPLVGNNLNFILKKSGMPIRKNGQIIGYGDLIVKFIISLVGLEYHQKQAIINILDKNI